MAIPLQLAEQIVTEALTPFSVAPHLPSQYDSLEQLGIDERNAPQFVLLLQNLIFSAGYDPPPDLYTSVKPRLTVRDVIMAVTDSTGPR
jgi:hypothetical protein